MSKPKGKKPKVRVTKHGAKHITQDPPPTKEQLEAAYCDKCDATMIFGECRHGVKGYAKVKVVE